MLFYKNRLENSFGEIGSNLYPYFHKSMGGYMIKNFIKDIVWALCTIGNSWVGAALIAWFVCTRQFSHPIVQSFNKPVTQSDLLVAVVIIVVLLLYKPPTKQ